jgi:dTDP-4-dehydrorhamnose 3,5-epimerase
MTPDSEPLPGVHVLKPFRAIDDRGVFTKSFVASSLRRVGVRFDLAEEFFSTSHAGVVRGMHFQTPPHAHNKIITCLRGRVHDVLLDLRRSQATFGAVVAVELSEDNGLSVYVPVGVAHGFMALEDDSLVHYLTDGEHSPAHDSGVHWDSFGYVWPTTDISVRISQRDAALVVWDGCSTPFDDSATV